MMVIYCTACNENHDMDDDLIERLVYGFQGELSDAYDAWGNPLNINEEYGKHYKIPCLLDQEGDNGDVEAYGEFISGAIDARLTKQTGINHGVYLREGESDPRDSE